MSRVLVVLGALIGALFGLVSSTGTAIASSPPSVQLTYAYDGHGHPVALTDTTTDRGPPETYDNPNGYDAGGPWAVGGPAYPVGPTTPVTYGYDDLARPVQIASRTGDRDGQVGLAEGGSVVVLRSGVAAKSGPGAWGTAAESMSSRAAAYQARVTGGAAGSVYRVGGVKFDGFANGVLQEAKGPGYAKFVRNGQFQPWFSGADGLASQAQRQLAAAGGTPITWSVAESQAATAINNLFMSRGISGINVMYVP